MYVYNYVYHNIILQSECFVWSDPSDTSAEEKEIIELTGRLLAAIFSKDHKEY